MGYNKRLCCWLVLAAALTVGFCLGGGRYVAAGAAELEGQLAEARLAVAAADWPRAEQLLREADACWQQQRRVWLGLMNHQDVSNIDLAFAGAGVYARAGQQADALAQLRQAGYFLQQAVESDRVCWHNLF